MEDIVIFTERLTLRPITVGDLETANAYALDRENTRYMVRMPRESAEETLEFLRGAEEEWKKDRPAFFEFAVLYRGGHIGGVSLYEEDGAWELGWIINAAYRGRGFAQEAARAVIGHFSESFGIRHFTAHCDTENMASRRVMEKLGMTRTGESGGRRNRFADRDSREYRYDLILPPGGTDAETVDTGPGSLKEMDPGPAACDPFTDERDLDLIGQDRYTFSILARLLKGPCDIIRSDHQKLILCHTGAAYPVWLWTPDGLSGRDKEAAWALAEACRPLKDGYRYNMKYELAEFFIEKARQSGIRAGYAMRLFAYDCPAPVGPAERAEGRLHVCSEEDIEEAAGLIPRFYTGIGDTPPPREHILEKVRDAVADRAFFFWKDGAGNTAALCSFRQNGSLAWLGSVYTLPEHRRKHCAQTLVYEVTKIAKERGLTPMLYTDADYEASNACYTKIGYTLRGRLCTIAAAAPISPET